jgi:serine protease AprX
MRKTRKKESPKSRASRPIVPAQVSETAPERRKTVSNVENPPLGPGVGDTGRLGSERVRVLVEMRVPAGQNMAAVRQVALGLAVSSLTLDPNYEPVPVSPSPDIAERMAAAGEQVVVVRGTIESNKIPELEARAEVLKAWRDPEVAPFTRVMESLPTAYPKAIPESANLLQLSPAMGPCPIGTCDCSPGTPKGTIADVARYLGVDHIWADGYRGDGIVVAVVDGGITALGRTPKPGETAKIPRVIGGFPGDWGTTAAAWGDHGNMCATDVLGMAPNAQIYDIRIASGSLTGTISNALAGYDWAINQHRANGTPQAITNSWGIFQQSWGPDYACNANHPFTRKVVDALNEGILVLFAAGNCGDTCPDGRCGSDTGPGKSIWGANGHPRVMTVGAVNKNEQFVGYSSRGPACLDPNKPDYCSVTHFTGYFASDSGTSAATPIAAGVVALLKQANPALTQDQAKTALRSTAKDIGPAGWDQHSGAGIIRAKAAYDQVIPPAPVPRRGDLAAVFELLLLH